MYNRQKLFYKSQAEGISKMLCDSLLAALAAC